MTVDPIVLEAYRAYLGARAVLRRTDDNATETSFASIVFASALRDAWLVPSHDDFAWLAVAGVPPTDQLELRLGCPRSDAGHGQNHGGKDTFYSKNHRVFPTSGLASNHLTHAAGLAWAMRMRAEPGLVLASFRRAHALMGDFHSGINFAAVTHAPCVFVCTTSGANAGVAERAEAYGIFGARVRSDDLSFLVRQAKEFGVRARLGEPCLIEVTHDTAELIAQAQATLYTSRVDALADEEIAERAAAAAYQQIQGRAVVSGVAMPSAFA